MIHVLLHRERVSYYLYGIVYQPVAQAQDYRLVGAKWQNNSIRHVAHKKSRLRVSRVWPSEIVSAKICNSTYILAVGSNQSENSAKYFIFSYHTILIPWKRTNNKIPRGTLFLHLPQFSVKKEAQNSAKYSYPYTNQEGYSNQKCRITRNNSTRYDLAGLLLFLHIRYIFNPDL